MNPWGPGSPNPGGVPPAPPPPPRPNPFEPPPVGSYGGYAAPTGYSRPTSSDATAALVCGILAWGCFPLAIVALVLGAKARRNVRASGGQLGGEQIALAGMILGGVFGTIHLLVWLAYLAFFGFSIATGLLHK